MQLEKRHVTILFICRCAMSIFIIFRFPRFRRIQAGAGVRGGLVQGCESECAGMAGIPLIEHGNIIQVSKFLFNKQLKIYISCFLRDIEPVFKFSKKFHFMFSGSYSSHIQYFQESMNRAVQSFWAPSQHFQKIVSETS